MDVSLRAGYELELRTNSSDVSVMIDVFRASTAIISILEGSSLSLLVANDIATMKGFSDRGFLVVSDVFNLGIDNTPTLVKSHGVLSRNIILKTSNLTAAIERNKASNMIIASFNNLEAVS